MAVETIRPGDVPSKDRVEPGSVNIPLGIFPPSSVSSVDPEEVTADVLVRLNKALVEKNAQAVSDLFYENSYWRDHLCLSWDLRTMKGPGKISELLGSHFHLTSVEIDKSSSLRAPHHGPIDGFGDVHGIQSFMKITTELGSGLGVVRLAEVNGLWKIFTLFTSLRELRGHEETVYHRHPRGVEHGVDRGELNWQDKRNKAVEYQEKQPDVLILGIVVLPHNFSRTNSNFSRTGAGQSGLTTAARLKMLGVDALIIEQEDKVGASWRKRYHQLVLHDPVWFDHLPYVNFPPQWPIFTPKDKLAEFFEAYVKLLELNVWTRTSLKSCSWDNDKKQWTVILERGKEDDATESRTLHVSHIIQATGHSGKKNAPVFKGQENFQGDRICHSSEFSSASPDSHGKKAVIVGSSNSAHDIAHDYYEKGYDVTMVQRSTTCVISSDSRNRLGLKGLYAENGPPTEDADLLYWAIPSELYKSQQVKVTALQNKNDVKTLEGLKKVGFQLDMGPNEAGYVIKYLQRGGGYYIDVGASKLLIEGKVKLKTGQEVTEILPHGLRFGDGSELEADEIIFATGFQNMRTSTRAIFGDEVADRVGDVWGFDQEGELRSMWRPSGHPGFWFMGGNLAFCRYYSRIVALQIKAKLVGISI